MKLNIFSFSQNKVKTLPDNRKSVKLPEGGPGEMQHAAAYACGNQHPFSPYDVSI